MKYFIASDSFKGSLSAKEVNATMAEGILMVDPDAEIDIQALADGGEGTADLLRDSFDGKVITMPSFDALMRPISTQYIIADVNGVTSAIIDVASVIGITQIDVKDRDIMNSSSFGVGPVLMDAYRQGCRNFIIGLGGSATCDGGIGILKALGYEILDERSQPLDGTAESLISVSKIKGDKLKDCHFDILCDVDNPLYGPKGAALMFAAQKGANSQEEVKLDLGLRKWDMKVRLATGRNVSNRPGAGAAGGLGAMFAAFFNASLGSGINTLLDIVRFEDRASSADLIITGEGQMDAQTLHGKVPMGVLNRAKEIDKPVIAFAGGIQGYEALNEAGFRAVFSTTPFPMSLETAMTHNYAKENLRNTVSQVIRAIRL